MSVNKYINQLPKERQGGIKKLISVIRTNLPQEFNEQMNYGMPSWVVPHSKYKEGYHCNPELPLPFLSISSRKNFIALYHMGIYVDHKLMNWFIKEYPNYSKQKLDMGKSCIRFKKIDQIPFELIGKLCKKMTVNKWISIYEKEIKKSG